MVYLRSFSLQRAVPLTMLTVLTVGLFVAGGASRSDVLGQPVIRALSTVALAALIAFGGPVRVRAYRAPLIILAAIILLAFIHIIPLPPSVWQALPGREPFLQAASLNGVQQPWRPLSLFPDGALNALGALLVPAAMFAVIVTLPPQYRMFLLPGVLCFIALSAIIGVMQAAGLDLRLPFINQTAHTVTGVMANRNHHALLLALGIVLAVAWAFTPGDKRPVWGRIMGAGILIVIFASVLLLTGSRGGLLLGGAALLFAAAIFQKRIRALVASMPGRARVGVIALALSLTILLPLLFVGANRALSLQRVVEVDASQDMRVRAAPTVWDIVETYFPFGAGSGAFDRVFRMHEPLQLLKPTYFNHAHNDFAEILLDYGVPGALVLGAALLWLAMRTVGGWRGSSQAHLMQRVGAAMILLVLISSAVDYPARVPIVMALLVIAASWLCEIGDADLQAKSRGAPLR